MNNGMNLRERWLKDENGKPTTKYWVVDFVDRKGKRRQKRFWDDKLAIQYIIDAGYELKQGTWIARSDSCSVSEAADDYLKELKTRVEPSSYRSTEGLVRNHIKPDLGDVMLPDLTQARIESYWDDKIERTTQKTAQNTIATLASIVAEAQGRGRIAQNVVAQARDERRKRRRQTRTSNRHSKIIPPSKSDINQLIANADGYFRPMLLTLVFTGMRLSEVRGLPWSNVDFDARVIRVTQRADEDLEIGPPKTDAGYRSIEMAPMLLNALKEWKLACPKSDLDLVFPTKKRGTPHYAANIHKLYWRPLLEACDLMDMKGDKRMPRFRLHDLRHFYASWLISLNFDLTEIATRLGHADYWTTVSIYGHLLEKSTRHDVFAAAENDLIQSPVTGSAR